MTHENDIVLEANMWGEDFCCSALHHDLTVGLGGRSNESCGSHGRSALRSCQRPIRYQQFSVIDEIKGWE